MSDRQILALDQGTRSSRAAVFDGRGRLLAIARRPVDITIRGELKVEQSAVDILASIHDTLIEALADPAVDPGAIRAAGLATQRSSVIAWDRVTGEALSPVIGWQDRRAVDAIADLATHAAEVIRRTGLRLSPHYGAAKIQWLLREHAAVRRALAAGRLLVGPLASFLAFHLLRGRPALVDHANASRTLLWNLHKRDWDPQLLDLFQVPAGLLPACRPIVGRHGRLVDSGIPLTAMNGDQTAALHAQGVPADDTLVVNIGTGAFVLLPVTDPRIAPAGLLAGIASSGPHGSRYYLEGTVNGAGAALAWAERQFGIDGAAARLPAWLNEVASPPVFLDTVGGLGAPWWRPATPPRFLTPPAGPAEGCVAVVEGMLFLIQANIDRLREVRPGIRRIAIGGGLARLDGLCQRLADLAGLPVTRADLVEATARGIAWQAAGQPGGWPSERPAANFEPQANPGLVARYRTLNQTLGP